MYPISLFNSKRLNYFLQKIKIDNSFTVDATFVKYLTQYLIETNNKQASVVKDLRKQVSQNKILIKGLNPEEGESQEDYDLDNGWTLVALALMAFAKIYQ